MKNGIDRGNKNVKIVKEEELSKVLAEVISDNKSESAEIHKDKNIR